MDALAESCWLTWTQVIPMLFYGVINAVALMLEMVGLIPAEKPVV
jgi:hypothetical protein